MYLVCRLLLVTFVIYTLSLHDALPIFVDPSDPGIMYVESQQGFVARLELKTGEQKSIKPQAPPGEKEYRFDWNSPIVISPHNNHIIYLDRKSTRLNSSHRCISYAVFCLSPS